MSDDETPTPRLTGKWIGLAATAEDLATKLRAKELILDKSLVSLNPRKASLCRQLRMVCLWYRDAFKIWSDSDVPILDKQQQQDQFFALNELIKRVLE